MRNREVETKTKSNKDSTKKKKSIRLKKPDFKIPEFLKLTKKQIIWLVAIVIAIVTFICVSNSFKRVLRFFSNTSIFFLTSRGSTNSVVFSFT